MKQITRSEQETKELAGEFALKLKGGEVVALVGELGTGKTSFVRGAVEKLGSNVRVKSPTFTIMNEYPVDGNSISSVIHLDLYRFENKEELSTLDLEDYKTSKSVVFVEWPERVEFPDGFFTHQIAIKHLEEDERQIEIKQLA